MNDETSPLSWIKGSKGGCQTDRRLTVIYFGFIESEKSSGVTVTFIAMAWATIGRQGRENWGVGCLKPGENQRAVIPAEGKTLCLISFAVKTSNLI